VRPTRGGIIPRLRAKSRLAQTKQSWLTRLTKRKRTEIDPAEVYGKEKRGPTTALWGVAKQKVAREINNSRGLIGNSKVLKKPLMSKEASKLVPGSE